MLNKSFLQILLLSLSLLGIAAEQAAWCLDSKDNCIPAYCEQEQEQEQEDNNGEAKTGKSDKLRPASGFSIPQVSPDKLTNGRNCITICSDEASPAAYLPIFTPPPELV